MSQRTVDIHPHPKSQTRHRSNRNRRGFVPVWCGMCIGCVDGHLDHIYGTEFRGLCWKLMVQGIVGIRLRPQGENIHGPIWGRRAVVLV
jgi:hypothetical protein